MRLDALQRFLVQAELYRLPLIISQRDFELGDLCWTSAWHTFSK